MNKEIWKPVVGYRGIYEVSNLGNVKRVGKAKGTRCDFIKDRLTKHGYKTVELYNKNIRKHKPVHRLVAEAFICNPFNKRDVNHIDSNRINNKLENLEWVTPKENMEHCAKQGRIKIGSQKVNAKLTEKDILEIRSNKSSDRKISLKYNVSPALINGIKNRTRWLHVK